MGSAQDAPGAKYEVVVENVADPLGSEDEGIEVYKRAAHDLAQNWGIMFVYEDRCGPRVPGDVEEERLVAAGLPLPTEQPAPPPTKVFDNLYYVGLHDIAAWALVEADGQEIYIFDALNNAEEAEQYIAGGLRELGFDPANIKAVFVMHGHGDHYGGAAYLQSEFGAQVYMGAGDWPAVLDEGANPESRFYGTAPERGLDLPTGPMTIGTTEVQFFETPGHTDGTISALIPLTFNGEPHLAAYWGGTGYPRGDDRQLELYIDSLTAFTAQARKAGADVFMSNHSHTDAAVQRFPYIDFAAGTSDVIWGPDYVVDLLDVLNLCARAQYERQTLPSWPY